MIGANRAADQRRACWRCICGAGLHGRPGVTPVPARIIADADGHRGYRRRAAPPIRRIVHGRPVVRAVLMEILFERLLPGHRAHAAAPMFSQGTGRHHQHHLRPRCSSSAWARLPAAWSVAGAAACDRPGPSGWRRRSWPGAVHPHLQPRRFPPSPAGLPPATARRSAETSTGRGRAVGGAAAPSAR